jgi:hypothetical protein
LSWSLPSLREKEQRLNGTKHHYKTRNDQMKNDITDITLGAENVQTIRTAITTLKTEFSVFTVSLDEAQRKHSQHLGQRNETFSRDIVDLAKERPELIPASLNIAGVDRDITTREQLTPLLLQLQTLTQLLMDTHSALGIDIYNGARAVYAYLKVGADVNGISEALARIGVRFASQGRRGTSEDPVPDATTAAVTSSNEAK